VDDTNPTARALLALDLIQSSPGIGAVELGERLGVSDRAARRYVSILRAAGIDIDSSRGQYGGYRVARALRLPPLRFSAAEALGLVMAALDGHHPASDPTDLVGSALGKLIAALPGTVAAQAEAVRRTAAAVPDRSAARPDPGAITALVRAASTSRQVSLGYRSEAGREWESTVDPWAIVVRHGRWYLLCWSHHSEATRAYRIDRVTSVRVLDAGFRPPADLDPVAALEEHLAVGWEHPVEVVIEAPLDRVAWLPRRLGRLEAVDDQTTRLTGSTSNPASYAEGLALLPVPFRVVAGDEVRDAVRELGRRLLAAG
jgi:predicted DNA-binding transcriptional regulator YafY